MKNYEIKKVAKADCTEVLQNHYLTRQGSGFRSGNNYGLFDGDKLIGVAIFHTVSAWETVKGCFGLVDKEQKGFWELGRLVIDPEYSEKNLASWFLARAIRMLRAEVDVRALISYADSEYHIGYVYQACNFTYHGLTAQKSDFWVKQPDSSFRKQSRGKTRGIDGEWRPRTRKHRYLMVFDRSLRVRWPAAPYPKNPVVTP